MDIKLSGFLKKCRRVWRVLRKPTKEEFVTVAKVSAVGILAIGLAGFIIALIMNFIIQ
ncbi:MAG: protein translocase SEC61 complex subunit gamma [Nanoarchaeota archaeon]|nr:protein translocase SEC61 complex subunit gamma [Nanoarchaeota archaeon]